MAWKAALITFLFILSSCGPTMRRINICVISGEDASCAKGDRQYVQKLQDMPNWKAIDEVSLDLVATKLAECEANGGKLPPERTLELIEICTITEEISHVECKWNGARVGKPLSYIDGFFSTDEAGLQKIRTKLNFCGEKNPVD